MIEDTHPIQWVAWTAVRNNDSKELASIIREDPSVVGSVCSYFDGKIDSLARLHNATSESNFYNVARNLVHAVKLSAPRPVIFKKVIDQSLERITTLCDYLTLIEGDEKTRVEEMRSEDGLLTDVAKTALTYTHIIAEYLGLYDLDIQKNQEKAA
ncbi:MAG: hypothetical protein AABX19_02255 [Nanoarchaeota archaeon]